MNCDHIKRLITLSSDNIKRLSLYMCEIENKSEIEPGQWVSVRGAREGSIKSKIVCFKTVL
jgi:hypothetical protein